MTERGADDWRRAERALEDPVIDDGTLAEMFEASAARNRDRPAQRYKGGVYDRSLTPAVLPAAPDGEYASITYGEMRHVVRRLAAGFRDLGIDPGDRVAIYADTRMEWALTDFALLAAGAVVTTVYTESTAEQVRYLLEDPGATAVVAENADLLGTVHAIDDDLALSVAVAMDDLESRRADVHTLRKVYERGEAAFTLETYESWLEERTPGDLASLIYTSGTTGRPKGVQLTHRNFRTNVNQVYRRLGPRPDKDPDLASIGPETETIAFLPLAHVFERLAGQFVMVGVGATIGYAAAPESLSEDIQLLQPTAGISVPRVYERIYGAMSEQASASAITERLFRWGVGVAREWARTDEPGLGLRLRHGVADRLVFRTVRGRLGGNVEFMVSGGGSLSRELCETFVGMGLEIIEGYGLTETAPVLSVNPPEDVRPGTMGLPLVDLGVRIDGSVVDADEFGDVDGELGELLVSGPNVSPGYWNAPGAQDRAFTEDGWFRTGDLVERRADGFLVYHDRLKELFVLSTGKNVAPQPIEDAFATSDRIDQLMAVGDGRKFVGALVVPDFEALERWAAREDVELPGEPAARCRDERVRAWVQTAVDAGNRELEPVERIKEFALVPQEWTTEADLLTPSMKKKRRRIADAFAEEIEDIYDDAG